MQSATRSMQSKSACNARPEGGTGPEAGSQRNACHSSTGLCPADPPSKGGCRESRPQPGVRVVEGWSYNPHMGLARNLERRLEKLVDGLSATVFRGRMHPVDLANRLVRQADLLVFDGPAGPGIPNRFSVSVNEGDIDPTIDLAALTAELDRTLYQTAAERGWQIGGPINVEIIPGRAVGRGSIECTAASAPGPLPPWAEIAEHRGDRSFALSDNRNVVGRSSGSEVQLSEAEVSRHHAVLFREGNRAWVMDLASANGTTLNGHIVSEEPTEIGSGDMLSFGPATFAVTIF